MSDSETSAPRPVRPWRPVAAGLVLVAVVSGVTLYAARKAIAREALIGWLRSQGVESQVDFQAFDANGATGSLRIGPASAPDLTAEVVEIRYDLLGFWTGQPLSARVTSVRLLHPVLKARWHDGRLGLGTLDPLIEKLRKQPPSPGGPTIEIEGGRLRLDSDYGPLDLQADAHLAAGKLQRLDARLDPAVLKGRDLQARIGGGELHVVAFGNRVAIAGAAQVDQGQSPALSVNGATLRLTGETPYPDLPKGLDGGAAKLSLTFDAQQAKGSGTLATNLHQTLTFAGAAQGWTSTLAVKGAAETTITAQRISANGAQAANVRIHAQAPDLAWSRAGGDRIGGTLKLDGAADRLATGKDLALTRLAGRFQGPASLDAKTYRLALAGGASARGGWTGLGPARSGDTAGDAALKRALAAFWLDAPQVTIRIAESGTNVELPRPVRLTPDSGGVAVLEAGHGPLYADGTGAFRFTLGGGGLPDADLTVARYEAGAQGVRGQAVLKAKGSVGPVVGGAVDLSGRFQLGGGGLQVIADRCAPVSAARLELGENSVTAISGELCPQGAPLLALDAKGWRTRGLAKDFAAQVGLLEAHVTQASGPIDLASLGGDLRLGADIRSARLEDTAKAKRFRPLLARGTATLADQVWRGSFDLTDPAGRALAHAQLRHEGRTGAGGVDLDTGQLTFAEGGLQPAALSPLAAAIGSPATGRARFTGAIDWTADGGGSSHGTLEVADLDFHSPAGAVKGLAGHVVFTSLVPLRAAPGQSLQADEVAALVPLTAGRVTFGLDHDAIQVGGASFALSGGTVTVQPFEIPFAPGAPWSAVIDLEGVQVSDLVAASPFADRMQMKARVSGHIPFAMTPEGVRIHGGELHAIEPGDLTIRREALTQVSSEGGVPVVDGKTPPPPAADADPYSDFVYQAMENLAFTELKASVDSQAEGRLGVLFHIKGEHKPPVQQAIQLTWREVVTRKITRTLPLPSGTQVDLTLDTSVNLDQLLADFADYQSLHGSGPVQP